MKQIMNEFRRCVSPALIDELKEEPLFVKRLLPDIVDSPWNTRVFPAVRNSRIDFYYGGGKLFSFRKGAGFSTHRKYASVLKGITGDYVTEAKLKDAEVVTNFIDGYKQIKANCAMYSGVEASGVSDICRRSSFAVCKDHVVALDVEVSFSGNDTAWDDEADRQRDSCGANWVNRPDLLLYNTRNRTLRFHEAKHYSNPELWAGPDKRPQVAEQLERYRKQLGVAEVRERIVAAYGDYIDSVNALFGLELPAPATVDDDVVLYVFGYDGNQATRISEFLLHNRYLKGYRLRKRGNTSDSGATASTLWKSVQML